MVIVLLLIAALASAITIFNFVCFALVVGWRKVDGEDGFGCATIVSTFAFIIIAVAAWAVVIVSLNS